MRKVWTKIGLADENKEMGSISLLQILITWPDPDIETSTVTQLDNPNKAEYWKTVETPSKIATYLKLQSQLHFGQAHGTPFTVPPLSIEVDWATNLITSELVLEGEYSNSELEFLKGKLLNHCKKNQDTRVIGERIKINEWQDKYEHGRRGK
eukprot:7622569-Ditylum_brightwellii.AAC.1